MAVEQVNFKQEIITEEEPSNVVGFSDKIGKMLTKARTEHELTISQIAKILNIRVEHLTALEKNDYTNMPESSYTQGFLKSYASYLGLDGNAMVTELKQTGYLKSSIKHHIPQPIETNIIPSRTIVLGSMAILVLLLSVWGLYALQPEEKAIPAPEQKSITKKAQQKIRVVTQQPAKKEVATTTPAKPVTTVQETVPVTTNGINLVVNSEVWMQLRAPSGKVYMNKTFQAGDEYLITTPQDTLIDVGKPSAVSLYINGVDTTPWKKSNRRVIKGMSTDIQTITQLNKELR